ncbi:MAG: ribonuclease P protein component [Ignavibacteriaceae bacterium]|nr:ribonuclease P protein component [Ignavibacteriaceae bacterium]
MTRFGLSKQERIKSRKEFQQIFSSGKNLVSFDKKIKATFTAEKNNLEPGVKIAAAVSRKAGIAVWRNRVKRLIKESYRLNKYLLIDFAEKDQYNIRIIFSPYLLNQKYNKIIELKDITPAIVDVMTRVKSSL